MFQEYPITGPTGDELIEYGGNHIILAVHFYTPVMGEEDGPLSANIILLISPNIFDIHTYANKASLIHLALRVA
jgi:hypothetical protein